jgi:hypothetical protein
MKVIYIPEYKQNLIFFEKAGSSLMAGFFKSLLDWKDVKVTDKPSGNEWIGDRTLFVRNPLERLVSIFYHLNVVKGGGMTVEDKIEKMNTFLDGYEEKCATSKNAHLQPQSWDYDAGKDDRIVKVEDIMEGYNKLIDEYRASSNIAFNTQNPFFSRETYIRDFGILEQIGIQMDDKDRMFAVTLYGFILNKLNEGHHHNESHIMIGWLEMLNRRDVLDKLIRITKDEMKRFGYTNQII